MRPEINASPLIFGQVPNAAEGTVSDEPLNWYKRGAYPSLRLALSSTRLMDRTSMQKGAVMPGPSPLFG